MTALGQAMTLQVRDRDKVMEPAHVSAVSTTQPDYGRGGYLSAIEQATCA